MTSEDSEINSSQEKCLVTINSSTSRDSKSNATATEATVYPLD